MQADRDGRHEEFADTYDVSSTKKQALAQVELASSGQADKLAPETLKELSVRRATTNGFFATLFVLLKVPCTAPNKLLTAKLAHLCCLPISTQEYHTVTRRNYSFGVHRE